MPPPPSRSCLAAFKKSTSFPGLQQTLFFFFYLEPSSPSIRARFSRRRACPPLQTPANGPHQDLPATTWSLTATSNDEIKRSFLTAVSLLTLPFHSDFCCASDEEFFFPPPGTNCIEKRCFHQDSFSPHRSQGDLSQVNVLS